MDWKTFVSHVIEHTAWPLVLLIVLFQFRKELSTVISRLKKVRHKDTEMEFAKGVAQLVEERKSTGNHEKSSDSSDTYEDYLNFLLSLASISPRSAVLESFRILETSAAKKAAKLFPTYKQNSPRSALHYQNILKGKILTPQQYHQFNQLRELRNEAAHIEDFDIKGMPVEAYIDIALSLTASLESDT